MFRSSGFLTRTLLDVMPTYKFRLLGRHEPDFLQVPIKILHTSDLTMSQLYRPIWVDWDGSTSFHLKWALGLEYCEQRKFTIKISSPLNDSMEVPKNKKVHQGDIHGPKHLNRLRAMGSKHRGILSCIRVHTEKARALAHECWQTD